MNFKIGQRVKTRQIRGTVLAAFTQLPGKVKIYRVQLDNGILVRGSQHQFEPVRKS